MVVCNILYTYIYLYLLAIRPRLPIENDIALIHTPLLISPLEKVNVSLLKIAIYSRTH